MAKNTDFVSHKKSKLKNQDGSPKLPLASALVEGEIAINFAENVETLSIKNESGDVVTFSSDNYYTEKKLGSGFTSANSGRTVTDVIVENEEIVSSALNDLNDRIDNLDLGNEVEVNSGDTPSGQTIELWIDESITPIEADVYTKNETSGATQISTALEGKVDVSAYTSYTSSTATEIGSKAAQSDLTTLSGTVTGHTADTTIHLTSTEKEQLHTHSNKSALDSITGNVGSMTYENTSSYSSATEVNTALGNKANASDLADFFDDAKYEDSGTTKVINFYHGNTIKATIDASDFIVDGMVEDVRIENGNLVIDFNTASGKQDILIPLTDIFDPSNYYAKSETSGATQISNALEAKVNSATYNTHTGDTSLHFSGNEKRNLDALDTNIVAISGITATKVSNWDGAANNSHTHSNKSTLDAITASSTAINSLTGAVRTMAFQDASSYSSATEINTALSNKADKTAVDDLSGQSETIAAALNDLNARLSENSSTVANKADISDVEELEETLTAAVTDINTRMAENTALAELAEQVRLLTERVKALEDAAQTT